MLNERLAITGVIRQHALDDGDKTAVIIDGACISYGDFYRRITVAAKKLSDMGIGQGSHVVSVASPNLNFLVCMYAVLGLGAVHIPVENKVPVARLNEIAREVDARLVIAPEDPQCGAEWILGVEIEEADVTDWDWIPTPVSDACAEIIFTTGTTGKSKGVMLSLHCLETYLATVNPSFRLTKESVFIVTTPLNHVGGLHRIHQCMCAFSTVIVMDGIRDLRGFFAAIDTYGVTHTYLPPASVKMLLTLAKKPLSKLDGRLQFIYTASAPFPMADIEKLMELLPHTRLHQGYGSSETGSVCNCCYNAPGESINCLGKPYDGVEVKLIDAEGNPVTGVNQEGFICVKSDMNMLGYYKEPELTDSVYKDGYIHSRDLMFFDENGSLHFAGRGDDVINVRGYKIAPMEVENVGMKHPAIHECVCIPYEDRMLGRVVKMLVRLNEGCVLDQQDVTAYMTEQLEPYKVPQYIEEVSEITKTSNGKLDRKAMIRLYGNQ